MIEIGQYDTPIEAATKLIEGQYTENVLTFRLTHKIFELEELEEIAAHLMAYCKRQREGKENE